MLFSTRAAPSGLILPAALTAMICGCDKPPQHYQPPTLTDSAETKPPEPPSGPPAGAPGEGPVAGAEDRVETAIAILRGTEGHEDVRGEVQLSETDPGQVVVHATVEGLAPGSRHGFHIHEKGDCSAPDATSAGGHFAPRGHLHALPPAERHAGDMGNLQAKDDGSVETAETFESFTLRPGAPTGVIGRAIILHAEPDDGKGESGHAGPRIACGVIGRN